jgi:beta-phosphoglucomutase
MFEGMIFDMDGVIVDSHPIHIRAWKRLFCSLSKPVSDDELEFILDGHRREQILRHYLGDVSSDKLQEYGVAKDKLFREEANGLQTVPGLVSFLTTLEQSRIKKAVATSARRERAEFLLTQLGIVQHFATIVAADDLAEDKPDPHIFRLAGKRLGIDPANLLVAEDAISGVKAAKAAGMRCLAVTRNGREHLTLGADRVTPDFRSVSIADLNRLFTG